MSETINITGRYSPVSQYDKSVPQFGEDVEHINVKTIYLDTALDEEEFSVPATNFLWVIDASSLTAEAEFQLNDRTQGKFPIKKGFILSGARFHKILVTSPAQSGEWIKIMTTRGMRLDVQNALLEGSTAYIAPNTGLSTKADVTVNATTKTSVCAGNSNRVEVIISNLSGTQSVRVGDTNTGAARGTLLLPESSIVLSTTAEVFVYNPGASSVDIGVSEIEK